MAITSFSGTIVQILENPPNSVFLLKYIIKIVGHKRLKSLKFIINNHIDFLIVIT